MNDESPVAAGLPHNEDSAGQDTHTGRIDQGFALTWKDTTPGYWRMRTTRARLLEIREAIRMGVER